MHHEYIASGDSPKPLLFLITHRKWFHDGPWLWIYHCIDVVDWMFPCSHIHTMRSNPQCNGIWRLGLWDIISHKAKALMNGVSALIRGQAASSAIQSVVICYSSPNWVRQLMTSINFYFWTRPSPSSRLISNCIRWYFHLEPKEHFPHHQWFFPQFSPFVQIIPTQLFMPKKSLKSHLTLTLLQQTHQYFLLVISSNYLSYCPVLLIFIATTPSRPIIYPWAKQNK